MPDNITQGVADGTINAAPEAEPKLADYASRAKWFVAHSKWKLAQPSAQKHQTSEAAHQTTVSVPVSFIPKFREPESIDELEVSDLDGTAVEYDDEEES